MKKSLILVLVTIIITMIGCSIVFFIGYKKGQKSTKFIEDDIHEENTIEIESNNLLGTWKFKSCEYDLDELDLQEINRKILKASKIGSDVNATAVFGDWCIFINNDKLLIVFPNYIFDKSSSLKIGAFKKNENNENELLQVETLDEDISFINIFEKDTFHVSNPTQLEKLNYYSIIYEKQ